jgi:hypothetical protein
MGNIILFVFSFTLFGSSFLLPLICKMVSIIRRYKQDMFFSPSACSRSVWRIIGWLPEKSLRCFLFRKPYSTGLNLSSKRPLYIVYSEKDMIYLFIVRGNCYGHAFRSSSGTHLSTIPESKLSQATGSLYGTASNRGGTCVALFEHNFKLSAGLSNLCDRIDD